MLEEVASVDQASRSIEPSDLLAASRPGAYPSGRERLAVLVERSTLSPARLGAGAALVVAVLVVGWWLLRPPAAPVEASLPMATSLPSAGTEGAAEAGTAPATSSGAPESPGAPDASAPTELVVHAAGALVRPGVYRLEPGARVSDLVAAAGGLAADADGNRLNLAAPLADGERAYVPRVGEEVVPVVVGGVVAGGTDEPGGSVPGPTPEGPINVNHATLEQLDTLPGVGPATAQAIVDYRTEHGSFASIDELLEVRGIGDAKLAELRDRVQV